MADFPRDLSVADKVKHSEVKTSDRSDRSHAHHFISYDVLFVFYPTIVVDVVFSRRLRFDRDFGPGSLGCIVSHEVRGVIRSNLPYLPLFPPPPPPPSSPHLVGSLSSVPRSGGSRSLLSFYFAHTHERSLPPFSLTLSLSFSLSLASLSG